MILYTVFDANEGTELAFPTKKAAIECALRLNPGTVVERVNIGKPTVARVCDVFNHEGYSAWSDKLFETPDDKDVS